jgi:hypothetical protein
LSCSCKPWLHQHLIQFEIQSVYPHLHHTFLYSPPCATCRRLLILPQSSIVSCLWSNVFFPYSFNHDLLTAFNLSLLKC